MRVKYLAQEHNAVPQPGLEPGPPDPESSALTIRPPRLPLQKLLQVPKRLVYLQNDTIEDQLDSSLSVTWRFTVADSFPLCDTQ